MMNCNLKCMAPCSSQALYCGYCIISLLGGARVGLSVVSCFRFVFVSVLHSAVPFDLESHSLTVTPESSGAGKGRSVIEHLVVHVGSQKKELNGACLRDDIPTDV